MIHHSSPTVVHHFDLCSVWYNMLDYQNSRNMCTKPVACASVDSNVWYQNVSVIPNDTMYPWYFATRSANETIVDDLSSSKTEAGAHMNKMPRYRILKMNGMMRADTPANSVLISGNDALTASYIK